MVKPLINENTRRKISTLTKGDYEEMKEYIPSHLLPVQYGGEDSTPLGKSLEERKLAKLVRAIEKGRKATILKILSSKLRFRSSDNEDMEGKEEDEISDISDEEDEEEETRSYASSLDFMMYPNNYENSIEESTNEQEDSGWLSSIWSGTGNVITSSTNALSSLFVPVPNPTTLNQAFMGEENRYEFDEQVGEWRLRGDSIHYLDEKEEKLVKAIQTAHGRELDDGSSINSSSSFGGYLGSENDTLYPSSNQIEDHHEGNRGNMSYGISSNLHNNGQSDLTNFSNANIWRLLVQPTLVVLFCLVTALDIVYVGSLEIISIMFFLFSHSANPPFQKINSSSSSIGSDDLYFERMDASKSGNMISISCLGVVLIIGTGYCLKLNWEKILCRPLHIIKFTSISQFLTFICFYLACSIDSNSSSSSTNYLNDSFAIFGLFWLFFGAVLNKKMLTSMMSTITSSSLPQHTESLLPSSSIDDQVNQQQTHSSRDDPMFSNLYFLLHISLHIFILLLMLILELESDNNDGEWRYLFFPFLILSGINLFIIFSSYVIFNRNVKNFHFLEII